MENELERAVRHVREGRRIVAEQRDRVARLKSLGLDTREAESNLRIFRDTLAIFQDHLKALQKPHRPIQPSGPASEKLVSSGQ
jgi:DNA invertase Pin-like site-specific DNA recombinase